MKKPHSTASIVDYFLLQLAHSVLSSQLKVIYIGSPLLSKVSRILIQGNDLVLLGASSCSAVARSAQGCSTAAESRLKKDPIRLIFLPRNLEPTFTASLAERVFDEFIGPIVHRLSSSQCISFHGVPHVLARKERRHRNTFGACDGAAERQSQLGQDLDGSHPSPVRIRQVRR